MCKSIRDYDVEIFNKYIKYDESSETCLRWVCTLSNRVSVGAVAGSLGTNLKSGHRTCMLGFNKQRFIISRVVWILNNGVLDPLLVIDHKDGNPWNNHISNLRAVSQATNARNQKKHTTNTSGIVGVARYVDKEGFEYFMSNFSDGSGKTKQKAFYTRTHGEEGARTLAIEWRANGLKALEAEGIFYSDRHGT